MYGNCARDVHVFADASNNHNLVGVPVALSEYEKAAYFPSGDQLKALIVKLKTNGTWIISTGGHFVLSNIHRPDTRTN
jgi:hypothetical protein